MKEQTLKISGLLGDRQRTVFHKVFHCRRCQLVTIYHYKIILEKLGFTNISVTLYDTNTSTGIGNS